MTFTLVGLAFLVAWVFVDLALIALVVGGGEGRGPVRSRLARTVRVAVGTGIAHDDAGDRSLRGELGILGTPGTRVPSRFSWTCANGRA